MTFAPPTDLRRHARLTAAVVLAIIGLQPVAARAADYTWDGTTNPWETSNWSTAAAATYPDGEDDIANIPGGVVTMTATHALDYLNLTGSDPATSPTMLDASTPVNLYLTGGSSAPSTPVTSTIENASVGNDVTLAVGTSSVLSVSGVGVSLGSIRGIASTEYATNGTSRGGSGSLTAGNGTTSSTVSIGSLELDNISGQTTVTVNAGSTLTIRDTFAGSGIDGSDSSPNVYVGNGASLVGPSGGINAALGTVTVNAGGSFSTTGGLTLSAVPDQRPALSMAGSITAGGAMAVHGGVVTFTASAGSIGTGGGLRLDNSGSSSSGGIYNAGTIRGSASFAGDTKGGTYFYVSPDNVSSTPPTVGSTLTIAANPSASTPAAAAGNLTLGGNSVYQVAVDAAGDASKLSIAGQLSLGDTTGSPLLFVLATATPLSNFSYLIASAADGLNADHGRFDLTDLGGDTAGGYVPVFNTRGSPVGYFQVEYASAGQAEDIYLTNFSTTPPPTAPEPAAAALLLLAAPLLAKRRRGYSHIQSR